MPSSCKYEIHQIPERNTASRQTEPGTTPTHGLVKKHERPTTPDREILRPQTTPAHTQTPATSRHSEVSLSGTRTASRRGGAPGVSLQFTRIFEVITRDTQNSRHFRRFAVKLPWDEIGDVALSTEHLFTCNAGPRTAMRWRISSFRAIFPSASK